MQVSIQWIESNLIRANCQCKQCVQCSLDASQRGLIVFASDPIASPSHLNYRNSISDSNRSHLFSLFLLLWTKDRAYFVAIWPTISMWFPSTTNTFNSALPAALSNWDLSRYAQPWMSNRTKWKEKIYPNENGQLSHFPFCTNLDYSSIWRCD